MNIILEELGLVTINKGICLFGANDPGDNLRKNQRETKAKMTISKPFRVSSKLITQKIWTEVMGTEPWQEELVAGFLNPQWFEIGPNHPAIFVHRNEVMSFCDKLGEMTGENITLLTEVQWEYVARAGSDTDYYWGNDVRVASEYEWFRFFDSNGMNVGIFSEVAQLKPNPWGIFDIVGLVKEWVLDRADYRSAGDRASATIYPDEATDFFHPKGMMAMTKGTDYLGFYRVGLDRLLVDSAHRNCAIGFRIVINSEEC